jgi:DNA-binding MarR family transcriptional regulator
MIRKTRLDQFLTYRLHRVARLSEREAGAAYLVACGLNASEARCLAAIGVFEPLSINDLAQRADQDKGHASRSAKALVASGLVTKAGRPDDGRAVVLTLTRRGRAVHVKTMRVIDERNAAAFAVLSARERKLLGDMLDRIASSIGAS